jgi:hypothetical protein
MFESHSLGDIYLLIIVFSKVDPYHAIMKWLQVLYLCDPFLLRLSTNPMFYKCLEWLPLKPRQAHWESGYKGEN